MRRLPDIIQCSKIDLSPLVLSSTSTSGTSNTSGSTSEKKSEKPEKKKEKTKVPKIESKRKMKQQQVKPKRANAPTGTFLSQIFEKKYFFQITKKDLFFILSSLKF